jgi:hypothetical protein
MSRDRAAGSNDPTEAPEGDPRGCALRRWAEPRALSLATSLRTSQGEVRRGCEGEGAIPAEEDSCFEAGSYFQRASVLRVNSCRGVDWRRARPGGKFNRGQRLG